MTTTNNGKFDGVQSTSAKGQDKAQEKPKGDLSKRDVQVHVDVEKIARDTERNLRQAQERQDLIASAKAQVPESVQSLLAEPTSVTGGCNFKDAEVAFCKASGLHAKVFKTFAEGMQKGYGPIALKIFDNPQDKTWLLTLAKGLGARLKHLPEGQAVGMVNYHPKMYGGAITHVSIASVNNRGELTMAHHESVELAVPPGQKPPGPVDGYMRGTVGVGFNSLDTRSIWEKVGGAPGKPQPAEESYRLAGPPSIKFITLKNEAAFKAKAAEITARTLQGEAPAYVTNPKDAMDGFGPGSVRATAERLVPVPSGNGKPAPGHTANTCAHMTAALAIAGEAEGSEGLQVNGATSLADTVDVLFLLDALPNTKADLTDRMRDLSMRVEKFVDPADGKNSARLAMPVNDLFTLGGADGWVSLPDTGTPSDVPGRFPTPEERAGAAAMEKKARTAVNDSAKLLDLPREDL